MKVWLLVCILGLSSSAVLAQDRSPPDDFWDEDDEEMFNVKLPTFGGKQFWTDHAWRKGWRLQQNALTGHWRLLDNDNVRQAWGSREECQELLDQLVPDCQLASPEAVVLLHGLMRSSGSMRSMGEYLQQELGLLPIYFEYASTRSSIAEHAQALKEFLDSLPSELRLHFVGHSMGNIVLRHYIGDVQRSGNTSSLGRMQSVVMLGPPNQGASIARQLSKTGAFGWIVGRGGVELGPQWHEIEDHLAIPTCPFAIIAGKMPESVPSNPLVPGDSDLVVSVEETHLDGAADTLEVPRIHSFLMDSQQVQQATVKFIQTRSRLSDLDPSR